MSDLVVNLALAFGLLGGYIGWTLRALIAERDQDRAEEKRDREWDKAHGTGDGDGR